MSVRRRRSLPVALLAAALFACGSLGSPAAAASSPDPVFTYYPTLTQGTAGGGFTSGPRGIATGSDGALWFTQEDAHAIGRVDTAGHMTDYPVPGQPINIAAGPDGALWFTDLAAGGRIGRITTAGSLTEFPTPSRNSSPIGIALGPDHAMWFTEVGGNKIGRIDAEGNITEFPIPTQYAAPGYIAAGPDGAMWFAEDAESGAIGRITSSGDITEYPVADGNSSIYAVTSGPDGSVWFTSNDQGGSLSFVGRIDPITDAVTTYPLPDGPPGSDESAIPTGIVTGPDGALWITLQSLDEIARMTTDGHVSVYPISSPSPYGNSAEPFDITVGPDAALWFTESYGSAVGRLGLASNSPVFTSDASASVGMRSSFDVHVTTTSTPTASLTESGALPSGVTFVDHGDGTADLAGDALAGTAGTYPITLAANNGTGTPTTQAFTLTVTSAASAPGFTSPASVTDALGSAFTATISTDGYPAPKLARSGTMPNGVQFTDNGNGTATLSGTSAGAASGPYPLTLTATNKVGSATQHFVLTVTRAPSFKNVPARALVTQTGMAYSLTTVAIGYPTPAVTEVGALPPGLTFIDNGDGTSSISGTPSATAGGSYLITESATNPQGSTHQSFTIKVDQAPAITSGPTATATIGAAFSDQVTTTGYPAPKLSVSGSLPKGISFTPATGTFSGAAKKGTAGSYQLTLTATNVGGSATQSFVLNVQ